MATKWILTQGIGFSPGSTRHIPPLGFLGEVAAVAAPAQPSVISPWIPWTPMRRRRTLEGSAHFLMAMRLLVRGEVERKGRLVTVLGLHFLARGHREALASGAFVQNLTMKVKGRAVRTREQREKAEEYELLGIDKW